MIRVILADDHPMILKGVSSVLLSDSEILVVGTANNGLEALYLVEKHSPDVLILDMEMPVLNGLEVTKILKRWGHPVRILILSAHNDIHFILGIFAAGASGYLLKDDVAESIVQAVHDVARGQSPIYSPKVAEKIKNLK